MRTTGAGGRATSSSRISLNSVGAAAVATGCILRGELDQGRFGMLPADERRDDALEGTTDPKVSSEVSECEKLSRRSKAATDPNGKGADDERDDDSVDDELRRDTERSNVWEDTFVVSVDCPSLSSVMAMSVRICRT